VIITSNLDSPDGVPVSPPGTLCAAAIDVEWSKNYRLRGGNVPFCYSVTWLVLSPEHVWPGTAGFWYTSAYVQDASETGDLAASADRALRHVLDHAGLIAGHQLSSDLAVLTAAAPAPHPGITPSGRHGGSADSTNRAAGGSWTPGTTPGTSCAAHRGGWSMSAPT